MARLAQILSLSLPFVIGVPAVVQAQPAPAEEAAPSERAPAPEVTPDAVAPAEPAEAPAVEVPAVPAPVVETPPADGRLDAVVAELRRIKEELGIGPVSYESYSGLGPAASKVYFTPKGLSIGGYGEGYYAFDPAPGGTSETDLYRLVLYTGYRFNERIVFNCEIEFEHASTEKHGAVSVEFMYLDFKLTDELSLRAGNLLVPMGFINEIHEPVFFNGMQRPEVERRLIPSTWNDNGVGVYGSFKGLSYRAYLLDGLQAFGDETCVTDDQNTPDPSDDTELCQASIEGFSGGSWIRGGRQGGSEAIAENLAVVGRVDYQHQHFLVGASGYFGRSGQGREVGGEVVKGEVLLTEGHAQLNWKGLTARALVTWGSLGDAEAIASVQGGTIGSQVLGGYGEVAFDVFSVLRPGDEGALTPFVRYENVNLHFAVPPSQTVDPGRTISLLTAGVGYRPVSNVVVKADWQRRWTGAGDSSDTFTLGTGFVF